MVMSDFMLMCKKDLIMHLNSEFKNIDTLDKISNLSEQLEYEIEKFIKKIILMRTKRFFLNFSKSDQIMVDDEGNVYNLEMIPLFESNNVMQIRLCREEDRTEKGVYTREVDILGNGRRKKIIFVLSRKLRLNKYELQDMVKMLYETGYNWFAIAVEGYVSKETVSVGHTVYNFVRSIFCNDEINKAFWIAIVGKGYGFRLVNLEQVKELFTVFAYSANGHHSINDYVGNLISTRLPYDKLLMKEALDYNEKINGDIANAKYTREGNLYSKTMSALYQGNAFSIYPIINGEIGVLGLYPVEHKEIIEKHLEARKVEITEIIRRELSKIDLAYKLFDDNYQEKFKSGISYLISEKGGTSIMVENIGRVTEVLEEYYDIYCKFNGKIVMDADTGYSYEELQYRKILEKNGLLQKDKGGYCITEKGIRHFEGKAKPEKSTNISTNQGVIIFGDNSIVKKDVCLKNVTVNERADVDQIIGQIKEIVHNTDENEYVNTLLNLLEKELNHSKPKKNMVGTILKNLAAVSTISSFVIKLKELLGL